MAALVQGEQRVSSMASFVLNSSAVDCVIPYEHGAMSKARLQEVSPPEGLLVERD
jgi:hypothetical protein